MMNDEKQLFIVLSPVLFPGSAVWDANSVIDPETLKFYVCVRVCVCTGMSGVTAFLILNQRC